MKSRALEVFFGCLILSVLFIFSTLFFLIIAKGEFKTYILKASFYDVGGLVEGSKVNINGVKVGKVSKIELSVETYEVIVTMIIDNNVKIPKSSVVFIKSGSFFDAPDVVIIPSRRDTDYATKNYVLRNTKDWISLEDKIGNIFFDMN